MDIPDLVQRALGDEEMRAGVSLGDGDAVCFTPTRALVYNGEGLLSDEGVEEFRLDAERLGLKRGRRKTKFVFQYLDGRRSFSVPSNRGDEVLERLLEGVLRLESVVDEGESVAGVYLFSELTLVVTERRAVKHVGEAVWDGDYEVYDFADVTGLEFERTSVATSIVLDIRGHPQRVKVPNDDAAVLRRTLQEALFEFHDVESLEELDRLGGDDGSEDVAEAERGDDLTFGSDIDPLVTDRDGDPAGSVEDPLAADGDDERDDAVAGDDPLSGAATAGTDDSDPGEETAGKGAPGDSEVDVRAEFSRDPDPAAERPEVDGGPGPESDAQSGSRSGSGTESGDAGERSEEAEAATDAGSETPAVPPDVATREDVQAVADRLEELADAVDRQNELLERQHRAMEELVERLDVE